jgi:hypothetical protein
LGVAEGGLDRGLYFYGSRWYDSSLGRFIQADDILAQNNGHWYHLLDLAAVCDTLIADNDSLHHLASSAAAGVERDESMNYMSTPMSC